MIESLTQIATICVALQFNSVTAENLYTTEVGQGSSARVIRNTIIESFPIEVEPTEQGRFVRGGDRRTQVLIMLVADSDQHHEQEIVWTYSETSWLRVFDGAGNPVELAGQRRPTVEDVSKSNDDSILILHIAQSKNHLTVVERDRELEEWKTSSSVELDLSSLATGQEEVGLAGRIVRIENHTYLHFWHASLPGNIVYHLGEDNDVSIETDNSVVDAVIKADLSASKE